MMKLNILNMNRFLETINECIGEIRMLCPDGKKVTLNRQYDIQNELLDQHRKSKNTLRLTLDIPNPNDYMSIVSYYAGDC